MKDLSHYYFILGASDPEMERIEHHLRGLGIAYEYATKDGQRCHPGNAYQADNMIFPIGKTRCFVECDAPGASCAMRFDHHRPGDPGFGLPPSEFWRASSLGQMYEFLELGEPPQSDLVLAAMDHCPANAIRGECPGVSREEIIHRKVVEIAAGTKTSEIWVASEIEGYRKNIQNKEVATIELAGCTLLDYRSTFATPGYSIPYLCCQVAVLAEGYAALIYTADRNANGTTGRHKICLGGHASPELVEYFISIWAPNQALIDIYGVPSRGYAGGYLGDAQ